jgi:ATP-binding cassette subfamily B protein
MNNKGSFGLVRRIILQAKGYRGYIGLLFLLNLLATPISLLKPYALKFLIDCGISKQPIPGFIRFFLPSDFSWSFQNVALITAALVVIIALVESLHGYVTWLLSIFTGEKLVLGFRTLLFNHIQRLSLAYHDSKGSSDSLYRIQWDSMGIRTLLLNQLSTLLTSFITLVSMIVVMFFINWKFAVIALLMMPPLVILSKLSTSRLKKDWHKVLESEKDAMSVINEVLNSLRVVKAFGREGTENERFTERSEKAVDGQMKVAKIAAGYTFIVSFLLAVGTAGFIYLGAILVLSGEMTLGDLTLVMAYLAQIVGPLQSIIKNLNDVQSSMTSIERAFAIMDEEPEVKEDLHAIHLPRVKGSFEFINICFGYSHEKPILRHVSFDIKSGDRVGIMGSTGAGKTTLINLLNRFYDPSEGIVKIDGIDIRRYHLADYRAQFSMVLQEPVLFSTSIAENIRYGRPEATEREIIEAAKMANAHEFIMRSPTGYDTLVGERGMQLSGGERQRISIARAFIKNAPVLILDEPTSSLDVRTESQIMEAIERLMEGRTTFMITHRLDSLNACNVILHLEQGELFETARDFDADFLSRKKSNFQKRSATH